MDNEKFVAQSLSSPLKSRISTLPSGAKSNWYYDHESDDVDKASVFSCRDFAFILIML